MGYHIRLCSTLAVAQVLWTQAIERRILANYDELPPSNEHGQSASDRDYPDMQLSQTWVEVGPATQPLRSIEFGDKVYLMAFTRSPTIFQEALHHGCELEQVRTVAAEHGQSCRL